MYTSFNVAGTTFRPAEEIKEAFDIVKRNQGKVRLIPEPTNPYDKNAVQVEVNGMFIGYVPKGENEKVLKELQTADEDGIRMIIRAFGGTPSKPNYGFVVEFFSR